LQILQPLLIAEIYETPRDPASWSVSLQLLGEMLGGKTTLSIFDEEGQWGEIPFSYGIDPAWAELYQSHYYKLNLLVKRALGRGVPAQILLGWDVVTEKELLASEIYNDWFRPQNLFHVAGGVVSKDADGCSILGVHRQREAEHFTFEELSVLSRVMPHCKRAQHLQQRLAGADVMSQALDKLSFGVIVLAQQGRILHANSHAEDILRSGDGLYTKNGNLLAFYASEHSRLSSLIRSACSLGKTQLEAGGEMAISRPSRKRSYGLIISRTTRQTSPLALVIVTDCERSRAPTPTQVIQLFGFTPSEAQIAERLAQGTTAAAIAKSLDLSVATIRTHIRHILEKTQTNRQTELVRLLLSISR
jgi:DNA-binding CsgD family transcriptional regulator